MILCEALLDALTFWVAGYRHVTASYGITGFTAEHLALFQRLRIERVLIAYDRDDAGERAAEPLAAKLTGAGFRCYRVLFPRGLDANAYALANPPADKSLGLALRHAVFVGQGAAPAAGEPAATKETAAALPLAAAPASPAAASPEPPAPPPDVPVTLDGDDVLLTLEDRHYRIRGLLAEHFQLTRAALVARLLGPR